MRLKVKSLDIENFKGCKKKRIDFSDVTTIKGQNASGKTTILDAYTWLLFGKDSMNNEKFAIRPLDADGNAIHNIEISVTAVIDIDGKEHEIKKTQTENWVKKRGSATAVLQGNVNKYEVDGYPKKDAEFKAFVSEIIDENIFKMITSPTYFASMPWKDQRQLLMNFVADISDVELAKKKKEFAILLDELEKAPSTDDIQKKYTGQKKKLNDLLKEIPIRIDEIENTKVDIDVAELELAKADYTKKIAECEAKIKASDITEEKNNLADIEAKIKDIESALNRDIKDKQAELKRELSDIDFALSNKRRFIENAESGISDAEKKIDELETVRKALTDNYKTLKTKKFVKIKFDTSKEICPVCKRPFPEEDIQKLHDDYEAELADLLAKFESDKETKLEQIANEELKAKTKIDNAKEEIKSQKDFIKIANKELTGLEKDKAKVETKLSNLPEAVDITKNADYKKLSNKKDTIIAKINELKAVDVSGIYEEIGGYKSQIRTIDEKIAKQANNVLIDERIAELQTEQRETAQKIADAEKILFALEKFVKYKMDRVSNEINKHFGNVRWVLFETQINGGIKETCECSYNGVRYSDLNSGHKIVAGIEIIKALQELFEASAVVYVDNAESVNEYNLPDIDCQVVRLVVTEDKELVVG